MTQRLHDQESIRYVPDAVYLVGNKHINVLVNSLFDETEEDIEIEVERLTEFGQILTDENLRSYNYRCNDEVTGILPFVFTREEPVSPAQILKACYCYEGQSSGLPDYNKSKAANIIRAIRARVTRRLEGYEEAKWHIE